MSVRKRRQVEINGTQYLCGHKLVDVLQTEGGDPFADKCTLCGDLVAQYGNCSECGEGRKRLPLVEMSKRYGVQAWCSGKCNAIYQEREKARRKAERTGTGAR